MTLRLLSYNIRRGGAGREPLLAQVVADCDPDLVIFQEATLPSVVERLAKQLGFEHWGARAGESVAYISRVEVAHHEWHPLVRVGRGFLEVFVSAPRLRVFGVHLSAVHSEWTERRRLREMGLLLGKIEEHRGGLHLLAGDFNTLAPNELLETRRLPPRLRPFVWLSGGRVRYRTVQMMLDAGYVDAYRRLHPEDPGYTFPTWDPHVRLDFVFLPTASAGLLKSCLVVNDGSAAASASDHFPLLAQVEAGGA